MKRLKLLPILEKTYIAILLIIFGGIVIHAPLSVGLGSIFPDYDLVIKSWKEILLIIATFLSVVLIYKNKRLDILNNPIIVAIGIYVALHVVLVGLSLQSFNLTSYLAGLAIDLRFLIFFSLVYVAIRLYPKYLKIFLKVGIAGAVIVLVFALLQVFVLPHDVLKYIGYSKETISPFLLVDQNPNFIRINSTLRGPNPLGAYAVIVLALITSAIVKKKVKKEKSTVFLTLVLAVGGLIAIWASYSRSALVGAVIAVFAILILVGVRKLSKKMWIICGLSVIALIGSLILARDSSFVSNVIFHEDSATQDTINSNEEHVNSIKDGLKMLMYQPLGAGVGSTGSASLYTDSPLIIENQYLFVAHETGWLGLILFVSIFAAVMTKLWEYRRNWLSLGVMASGLGLAIIGLLLPVWVDDTVSIIWWGLAALVLGHGAKAKEL